MRDHTSRTCASTQTRDAHFRTVDNVPARPPLRRNVSFQCLLASFAISGAGDTMFSVALAAWVYQRTGSPAWVSAAVVFRYLPAAASAFTSAAADRYDRRRLLIGLDVVRAALLVELALFAIVDTPVAVGIGFASLVTLLSAPYRAATVAVLPSLVDDRDLDRANALEATVNQIAAFAGPVLGAVLLHAVGPASVFAFDAVTFVIGAVLVSALPRGADSAAMADADTSLLAGIRAVARDRVLSALVGLIGVFVVVYGAQQVLFVVVSRRFGAGGDGASLLFAATGLGALVAGIAIARRSDTMNRWLRAAAVLACAPIAMLAVVPSLPVAALAMIAAGIGEVTLDVAAVTQIQRRCDAAILGRVWGVIDSVSVIGTMIGAAIVAALLPMFGPAVTLVGIGGVASVVGVALAARSERGSDRRVARPARTTGTLGFVHGGVGEA
jgi:MFS family permease